MIKEMYERMFRAVKAAAENNCQSVSLTNLKLSIINAI
jgi:hypothetical protein